LSDIFLSYAVKDRARAEQLAQSLELEGWSVWSHREIPAGKAFIEIIGEALAAAKCVIVLWSSASVQSSWVVAEAEEGLRLQVLVPVLLETVTIPLAFRRIHAADLSSWSGDSADSSLQGLLSDIRAILGAPPK
jgi:hypothetical protein